MILSGVCLFLCAVYVCFGSDYTENVPGVVYKEQEEEPCKISIEHIDCKVNHLQVATSPINKLT